MSTDDSRRKFLQTSGLGIGWLAAWICLQRHGSGRVPSNPLAPKAPLSRHREESHLICSCRAGPARWTRSIRSRC